MLLMDSKCKSNQVCAGFRGVQATPRKIGTKSVFLYKQRQSARNRSSQAGSQTRERHGDKTTCGDGRLCFTSRDRQKKENAFNFVAMVEP